MAIEGGATYGRSCIQGGFDTRSVEGQPVVGETGDDIYQVHTDGDGATQSEGWRPVLSVRPHEPVLHHRDLQNLPTVSPDIGTTTVANNQQARAAKSHFSADPFHGKSDTQVVQAFKEVFDDLRDKSQDRSGFFEKVRYVNIDRLYMMSKDPDETDSFGMRVRDPLTGLVNKQFNEQQVYLAKNLVERSGLFDSLLESTAARSSSIFGRLDEKGWLSNKHVDRWLESEKAKVAR